jgi:hypothetical protein
VSTPPEPVPPQAPDPAAIRCPRCSAPVAGDQDWCLECGAPARTRLAQTPNWRLPTVAIGAIVLIAGALLAFAFVKLTSDNGATPAAATTAPIVDTAPAATVPPVVTPTVPSATTTAPPGPTVPSTVPGQTTPITPTPAPTTSTTTPGTTSVPATTATTTTTP